MLRSPRALTKIPEIAEATPSSRTQPVQSTPSRASPARMRSLIGSPPGGPPSGPANCARPPSRAIATAALAPPPTARNSLACALPSGGGNSSTRNTSSSTAMPVHKMRGLDRSIGRAPLPGGSSPEEPLPAAKRLSLDPGADDVMRDRDRGRRTEAVGMPAQQHQRHLLALEPARTFEFGIDLNLGGERLRMTADHQGHRKRPGLRREIVHVSARNAGLLAHLAHRLLDAF